MAIAGIGNWLPPALTRDPIPGSSGNAGTLGGSGTADAAASGPDSFTKALTQAVGAVEADQRSADFLAEQLAAGQISDVATVTIAAEKAYLSLSTLVQVRNKLLEAYQEFMRMQI